MDTKQDKHGMSVDFIDVFEFDVALRVQKESLSPKRNEGYYCQEMITNRALVTSALGIFCQSGDSVFKPVKCLDALGSTGVAGLLWKKYLGENVSVFINDPRDISNQLIMDNSFKNDLKVEILKKDTCMLLHEEPFSFVYLDCHTEAAFFLDSLMRNVAKNGLIAISTKDDCALYGRTPETALRNYGGYITRTFYSKELAARLIIAGLVRSAAIHSKGLKVMCVLSLKSTITIIVKVLKGPAQANNCMSNVKQLVHCNMCEDRAFYPSSVFPVDNPGRLLSCKCIERTPGKVVMNVGPVWCGHIFDTNFIKSVIWHSNKFPWKSNLKEVMENIFYEAWCPNSSEQKILPSIIASTAQNDEDQQVHKKEGPPTKKLKVYSTTPSNPEPPFYFNLHKHCPKGPKMLKTGTIVTSLQKSGFHASRTHFDPLGVRTNANLSQLIEIIERALK